VSAYRRPKWMSGEQPHRTNWQQSTSRPPFLEFYLILTDAAGKRESYPRNSGGDPGQPTAVASPRD